MDPQGTKILRSLLQKDPVDSVNGVNDPSYRTLETRGTRSDHDILQNR